jgi:ankyrin repeat protein
MDVALKIISIDEKLLSKLMDSAHTEIAKTVLTNDNLLKFNDINGDSLVHIACRNGNQEMVRFILDKDQLSLDVQNNYGKTPLHVLLESELDNVTKQQISNVILALHPNVNLQDLEHHTPVDIAMNNAEILSVFYEHGLLGIESTKIDEFI